MQQQLLLNTLLLMMIKLYAQLLIADCPDYAQIFVAPTALGIAYLRDCP